MFCQKCGNKLDENIVFCPKCGERQPVTDATEKTTDNATMPDGKKADFLSYVDKRISETTVFRSAQELLCCKMLGMVFWIWLGIAVLINGITVAFMITNFEALSFDDEETSITFIVLSVISIVIDTGGKRIIGLVMEKMYMKQPLRSFGGIIHSKIDMNALALFLNNSLKELSPLWSDSTISRDGTKIELSFNGMMVWVQFSTIESQGGAGKGVCYSIGLDRQSALVFKLDSQIKAVPILRAIIDYYYEQMTEECNT